jgi:hypothetical protein
MAKTRTIVKHVAPRVSKSRYDALVHARSAASARTRQIAAQRAGSLVGIGACALVGYLEQQGKMPSLGGFEPTLVAGLGLGFIAPQFIKGKAGQMCAEAGAALSGVAAYKLGSGAPIRVGADDDYGTD